MNLEFNDTDVLRVAVGRSVASDRWSPHDVANEAAFRLGPLPLHHDEEVLEGLDLLVRFFQVGFGGLQFLYLLRLTGNNSMDLFKKVTVFFRQPISA